MNIQETINAVDCELAGTKPFETEYKVERANGTIIINDTHLYKINHSRCHKHYSGIYRLGVSQLQNGTFVEPYTTVSNGELWVGNDSYPLKKVFKANLITAERISWCARKLGLKVAHFGDNLFAIA